MYFRQAAAAASVTRIRYWRLYIASSGSCRGCGHLKSFLALLGNTPPLSFIKNGFSHYYSLHWNGSPLVPKFSSILHCSSAVVICRCIGGIIPTLQDGKWSPLCKFCFEGSISPSPPLIHWSLEAYPFPPSHSLASPCRDSTKVQPIAGGNFRKTKLGCRAEK